MLEENLNTHEEDNPFSDVLKKKVSLKWLWAQKYYIGIVFGLFVNQRRLENSTINDNHDFKNTIEEQMRNMVKKAEKAVDVSEINTNAINNTNNRLDYLTREIDELKFKKR